MFEELRRSNNEWSVTSNARGGATCRSPNSRFYIDCGFAQPSSGSLRANYQMERNIELLCIYQHPHIYNRITEVVNEFVAMGRKLVYGTFAERVAALLLIGEFGVGGITYGADLRAAKHELFANYYHKDGSICMDALQDMRAARSIFRCYKGEKRNHASLFSCPVTLPETLIQAKNSCKHLAKKIGKVDIYKIQDDLITNSEEVEYQNGPSKQYRRPGTYSDAVKDFESLNPTQVRDLPNDKVGKHGILPDGRDVIVRFESSKAGHPTLEIQNKPHRDRIKFRYMGDKYQNG